MTDYRPTDDQTQALIRALQVLVLDPRVRDYLASYDPKALEQARQALRAIGAPATPAEVARATRQQLLAEDSGPLVLPQYHVVVGNLGTVYSGCSGGRARELYDAYVTDSKAGIGRASGEPVTLFCDEAITQEYPGAQRDE